LKKAGLYGFSSALLNELDSCIIMHTHFPLALGLSQALAELLSFVCLGGLVRLFFSGLSTVA
jgi:hypothetical protein